MLPRARALPGQQGRCEVLGRGFSLSIAATSLLTHTGPSLPGGNPVAETYSLGSPQRGWVRLFTGYRLMKPIWDRAAKHAELSTVPGSCRCEQPGLSLLCTPLRPPLPCRRPAPVLGCLIRGDGTETHADRRPPESAAVPAREASTQRPSASQLRARQGPSRQVRRQLADARATPSSRGDLLRQASDLLLELSSAQEGLRFIQKHRREPRYLPRTGRAGKGLSRA